MAAAYRKSEFSAEVPITTPLSLLGRQPILDRSGCTHAFELLFRPENSAAGQSFDGNRATAKVIINALTDFSIEQIAGPHKAYINFTGDLLLNDSVLLLPKERVVIEILEDVAVSDKLVSAVTALAKRGYEFALDDFVYEPKWQPLIEIATTIKIDVLALGEAEIRQQIDLLKPYSVSLLAEKVETRQQHAFLMDLDFDYFQGYYYAEPELLTHERIPDNHLSVLQLLAALNNPAATVEQIEALVGEDLSLSYRLLRYLNSAFFGLPRKVDSVRRGVIFFGTDMLRKWASLLVMASIDGKPQVLMQNALVRARMCEGLAKLKQLPDPDSFFTVGLFSMLDSLMDASMESIVKPLPLSAEIVDALIDRSGGAGAALNCVCAYEACRWADVDFLDVPREEIGKVYLESIAWALDASSGL